MKTAVERREIINSKEMRDKLGHFEIKDYKFCPNCGLDNFSKQFGCGSCGGMLAISSALLIEIKNKMDDIR